jgi:hypothetical protein
MGAERARRTVADGECGGVKSSRVESRYLVESSSNSGRLRAEPRSVMSYSM